MGLHVQANICAPQTLHTIPVEKWAGFGLLCRARWDVGDVWKEQEPGFQKQELDVQLLGIPIRDQSSEASSQHWQRSNPRGKGANFRLGPLWHETGQSPLEERNLPWVLSGTCQQLVCTQACSSVITEVWSLTHLKQANP